TPVGATLVANAFARERAPTGAGAREAWRAAMWKRPRLRMPLRLARAGQPHHALRPGSATAAVAMLAGGAARAQDRLRLYINRLESDLEEEHPVGGDAAGTGPVRPGGDPRRPWLPGRGLHTAGAGPGRGRRRRGRGRH